MPEKLTERWMHPIRADNLSRWEFLWASYQGGDLWLSQTVPRMLNSFRIDEAARKRVHAIRERMERGMLRRHELESDESYAQRLDFATLINILAPMLDTIAATVTKAANVSLPPGLQEFGDDVDGEGTDLAEFRYQMLVFLGLWGQTYILLDQTDAPVIVEGTDDAEAEEATEETDADEVEEEPNSVPEEDRVPSRREEREAGFRFVAKHVLPLDLVHWAFDAQRHRFRWALIQEHPPLEVEPPVDGKVTYNVSAQAKEPYVVRLFHEGGWVRFRDGMEIDRGPVYWDPNEGIPLYPVVLGRNPRQSEPVGTSAVEDVAALQRLVFNVHSWYIEDLYNNCFHQTVIDSDEEITGDADRLIGATRYIRAKAAQNLTPDPAVFDHMIATINFHAMMARERLGLNANKTESPESGVALALRRENFDSFMVQFSTAAEGGERAAWRGLAVLEGVDPKTVEVRYSKDYTAFNIAARLEELLSVWDKMGSQLPAKAKAVLQKDAVRGVTPELPEGERKQIDDEIDTNAEELAERDKAEPLFGGFGGGFGEEDENGDMPPRGGNGGRPPPSRIGRPREGSRGEA